MKKTVAAAAFSVAAALSVLACGREPPPLTDARKAAIADTVRALAAALYADENRRSAEVFIHQVDAEDFNYASSGNVFPVWDSLAAAARRRVASLRELTYTLRQANVTVLAADAAAFTGSYDEVAVDSTGKRLTFRDAWTAVYARRNGQWKIIHGHFSRAPVVANTGGR